MRLVALILFGLAVLITGLVGAKHLFGRQRGTFLNERELLNQAVQLSYNQPAQIEQELRDPQTLQHLARFNNLSQSEANSVRISTSPSLGQNSVQLDGYGPSDHAYKLISQQLRRYIQLRQEGHTSAYAWASLTNQIPPTTSDPDLRLLAQKRPDLPSNWLIKVDSGTATNSVEIPASAENQARNRNEITRWTRYAILDGEVGWSYTMAFKADGSLNYIREQKADSQDYDPKHRVLIDSINAEVKAEMEKQGTYGQFGSVHTYWSLKKDKLKARGISWRSPAELNPNTNYD
ncbi:MAG: hypothetical protein K0Q55_1768 [Verrucomicrobia bacterium]|jgi:hypothetical protein|nr:hypothetical protein [Verrucomicrobiota bacterium]